MKILIASDHAGEACKKKILNLLNDKYNFIDLSPSNAPGDDYPDYAFKLGKQVLENECKGILICGTGIGMSIAANKVKGVRCAHITRVEDAKLARIHNDANVIALPSYLETNEITDIIETFINTNEVLEERHKRRVDKIIKYENGEYNEL